MRLDGLKNDLPETPNFIHNIIQEEVTRQTKTTNIIPMKAPNKLKWKIGRVAAVALIGIMGTSVAAYAGTKLYYMYLEHRGQYSVATGINVDEGTKKIQLPEEIHDIEISAGYIPDGMEWMDDYKLNYSDTPYQGGISISWVLMDQDDLGEAWIDKGCLLYTSEYSHLLWRGCYRGEDNGRRNIGSYCILYVWTWILYCK